MRTVPRAFAVLASVLLTLTSAASAFAQDDASGADAARSLQSKRVLLVAAALIAAGFIYVWSRERARPQPKLGGRNCPYCRHYNALEDKHCVKCEKWLPPKFLDVILREPLFTDLWATKLLASVSIIVFAFEIAAAGPSNMGLLTGVPYSVLLRFGALADGLETTEPWRMLSGCFVHMGVLHLVMNMLAFAELGRVVEREIKGPRLILAYFFTGIVGFLVTPVFLSHYVSGGASGALFGIDGVGIGLLVAKRDPRWKDMLVRTVIYSFMFYYIFKTNQAAHMGGLAAGIPLGVLFARESRPWRIATLVNVGATLSMVLIVVSLILPQRSPVWRIEARNEEQIREFMKLYGSRMRPRPSHGWPSIRLPGVGKIGDDAPDGDEEPPEK